VLRAPVDLLEKGGEGAVLALRLALDLSWHTRQGSVEKQEMGMGQYLVGVGVAHPAGQLVLEGSVAGEGAGNIS
jgi:hypothetical protein